MKLHIIGELKAILSRVSFHHSLVPSTVTDEICTTGQEQRATTTRSKNPSQFFRTRTVSVSPLCVLHSRNPIMSVLFKDKSRIICEDTGEHGIRTTIEYIFRGENGAFQKEASARRINAE